MPQNHSRGQGVSLKVPSLRLRHARRFYPLRGRFTVLVLLSFATIEAYYRSVVCHVNMKNHTEFGEARLAGKTLGQRADALIANAA